MGAIYGFSAGFVVAFWDVMTNLPGLSFQWIPPVSLVTCVAAGMIWSRVPVRGKSRAVHVAYGIVTGIPLAVLFGWIFLAARVPAG